MNVRDENEYEDLLAEWSDLESGLGIILSNPRSTQQFASRVLQYDRWMQGLLERDTDVGIYLLFQLAGNSPVGYSASHALVCAVLCHLLAQELKLPLQERNSLVHASMTMNMSMTAMQDVLATQASKPTAQQQEQIQLHPMQSSVLLATMGVEDPVWREIVALHHDDAVDRGDFRSVKPGVRLARVLKMVDRYAAMISPRTSRAGKSATESARTIMSAGSDKVDEIGHALIRTVGLCPPGTYVRMDSQELAVVVRRSARTNQPYVAIVGSAEGTILGSPRLHATSSGAPHIRAALAASSVRAQLNHYLVLQLGARAAQAAV